MMKSQNNIRRFPAMLLLLAMLVLALPSPVQADTVVLSPSGAGHQTNLSQSGAASNWQAAETDDIDISYVYTTEAGYNADFYNLTDVALTGTINSVTVYIKARSVDNDGTQQAGRTVIRTDGATFVGSNQTLTTSYTDYSTIYALNPFTVAAWTWSQVNALQAGVSLRRSGRTGSGRDQQDIESRATQVWVVVDYTSCEWIGETAWANGNRYVDPGNWATYTPYVADNTVILYAGQTMEAGTVHFSAQVAGLVTITIILNEGWRFYDDPENVKIQDYTSAPSGNPSPGLFDWKGYATESPFSIDVPENNFYGVHMDVEWEYCE